MEISTNEFVIFELRLGNKIHLVSYLFWLPT